jgi:hypothetical protein
MIVLYDLLPGVSADEFAKWSSEVDQPACRAFAACHGFDVYVVERQDGSGPRYQVIEDIRAESAEAWTDATGSPGHAHVMEQWAGYGVEKSVLTLYVRPTKIE